MNTVIPSKVKACIMSYRNSIFSQSNPRFQFLLTVLVHDVVLTSATDVSATAAARRASDLALDAIEGDNLFMSRTCDCRMQNLARKAAKKAQKGTTLNGEEVEEQIVEGVLGNLFEEE